LKSNLWVVLFSLDGCQACLRLHAILEEVLREPEYSIIAFDHFESDSPRPEELEKIQPRVFPTVIAFKDGVPMLGWEGFATMATHDISIEIVSEALNEVLALERD